MVQYIRHEISILDVFTKRRFDPRMDDMFPRCKKRMEQIRLETEESERESCVTANAAKHQ